MEVVLRGRNPIGGQFRHQTSVDKDPGPWYETRWAHRRLRALHGERITSFVCHSPLPERPHRFLECAPRFPRENLILVDSRASVVAHGFS